MSDREKELLNCFRQLPSEDQAEVLSHVRAAQITENSVKKTLAMTSPADGGSGKGQRRGKARK
ncbi:MAG: hypothetical protein LBN21_08785 [Treponema sp.]|jgi:hypothetical protein|nr:hypothetical protein [Treponema sp.]